MGSHPELMVAEGLRRRGVPVVTQHADLVLPNGRSIRLDLAVPDVRWAVEIDLHPDHLLLQGTSSDKQRDRQCHRIGWEVERVTELDLIDLEGICDELAELYRVRCRDLGRAA
jgi:very-short-patch-repair endonuclease